MKISREQILALEREHSESGGGQTAEQFFDFCYALIALAQEVEPLKFEKIQNAVLACSMFGTYTIEQIGGRYVFRVQRFYENRRFDSEEEAIEAAQQDYARRVKSGLKCGGGE